MTKQELKQILADHEKWLKGKGGKRANLEGARLTGARLTGANLEGAILYGANLAGAYLEEANLKGANLERANLRAANLCRANLAGANLAGANLRAANLEVANLERANLERANLRAANLAGANLAGANLAGANLCRANLAGANLAGANLRGATLPDFQICPETGSFTGWKKLGRGSIAKLDIPAEARRTSCLTGRKCRAEFAKVLEITFKGEKVDSGKGFYKTDFSYAVGQMVYPDSYDDDIRIECTHGIHFFMTREEAEDY